MQDLDELKYHKYSCFSAISTSTERENKQRFFICAEFEVKKISVSSFYKENNFKPCLTKQLLNMFKLWCEWGIR